MTAITNVASSAALELHGREHHGQALDAVWPWPAGKQSVSMDTVLGSIANLQAVDADFTQYCKLQRLGPDAQPIWLLGNSSRELVCSVNGRTLNAGHQVRLEQGDLIEIGLTRFEVRLEGQGYASGTSATDKATPTTACDDAFDLTSLADTTPAHTMAAAHAKSLGHADFSDLIPMEPMSLVGSELRTALPPIAGEVAQASPAARAVDPLEALHQQYLYKLRNPSVADEDLLWVDLTRGDEQISVDPLQSLMEAAGPRTGLDDLLGQPQSIQSVLDSLHPVGERDVLAPETFDSVMRLFAPESMRLQQGESLERMVQRSLPDLTRKEHHSLSVDSAMPYLSDEATQASQVQNDQGTAP